MTDAVLRFGATDDGTLTAQFRRVSQQLNEFEKGANKTAELVSTGFKAIASVVSAVSFTRIAKEAFEYADAIGDAAGRTGLAVEDLSRLRFAASQTDVEFSSLATGIKKFQVELSNAADGAIGARNSFAQLGLSANDLLGLPLDEQLALVADQFQKIHDPADRTRIAVELFGRAGEQLVPLLSQGAEGLRAFNEEADRLGITLDEKTTEALGAAEQGFKKLIDVSLSAGAKVLGELALGLGFDEGLSAAAELEVRIDRLNQARDFLLSPPLGAGLFLPKDVTEQVKALEVEIAQLEARLVALREGVSPKGPLSRVPLVAIKVTDPKLVPAEPTPQERRLGSLAAGETALTTAAVEEKDLLLQINQERLDEQLRQEEQFLRDRNRIASDGEEFLASVRETFGLEQIEFEKIKNQSLLDVAGTLFGALARENSKLAKIQQGIAIAETIWATAKGIAKAVAAQQWAVAAKIAITGAIQLAKIKATNYSASGAVSGAGAPSVAGGDSGGARDTGQTGDAGQPAGAQQRPQLQVIVNQVGWSREAIDALVASLGTYANEFDIAIFGPQSLQAQIIREGA